jgi:hypothetical protein
MTTPQEPAEHMTASRSSPAAIEPDGYVPGVCNIGPWETRRRLAFGIVGLVLAAALLAVLVAAHAPAAARALVLLPVWGGMFSVLQARRRFCGAYAMRRISNFGDTFASIRRVEDEAAHRADVAAVVRMTRDSFAVGALAAVVAVLLPL